MWLWTNNIMYHTTLSIRNALPVTGYNSELCDSARAISLYTRSVVMTTTGAMGDDVISLTIWNLPRGVQMIVCQSTIHNYYNILHTHYIP